MKTINLRDFGHEEMYATVSQNKDKECPYCEVKGEMIIFGLLSPFDKNDETETFHWCCCGYKWIEEP